VQRLSIRTSLRAPGESGNARPNSAAPREALEQRLMSGEPPVMLLDQDRSRWDPLIVLGLVTLQRTEPVRTRRKR
jgi:hypothetical protein